MSLLGFLFPSRKPVQIAPPKPEDHWDRCSDSFYVHDYRLHLDRFAQGLQTETGPRIYSRFNEKKKSAEIVAGDWGVLAAVKVHGSEGAPYKAVIQLNPFLKPEPLMEKFREIFGRLSLEFTTLQ